MPDTLLPLAISMGDPAGIGPEIVLKAINQPSWRDNCIVVGCRATILSQAKSLGLAPPKSMVDISTGAAPSRPGEPSPASGELAFRAVCEAVRMQQEGKVRAIVTAPLAKSAMQAAGHSYPGHTELLAELAGNCPVRMMIASPQLRVVLVSIHLALRAALDAVTTANVYETIAICQTSLRQFGLLNPRIGVAGLNPHAGEDGLFGREEIEIIAPAVTQARAAGIDASGPWPPDTVFMQARDHKRFDVVIAMYHDQGLIPVKFNGIEEGVNITLGLPYVRTSPDHGTAFDIAGRGIADPASLLAAIRMADELSAPMSA